ncbi:MAG TPA: tetratricopeptide repeat protein, partial [Myxococcota bacterium]|nr:tetratricopeptide repeat protein [Myxococcota bacterium]
RVERVLVEREDWRGVFQLLQDRMNMVSPELRSALGLRCRWLLAEKLSDSEEAWTLYQQLHAANPEDVEVLGALARMAAARGENELTVKYLDDLSSRVSPTEAAALQHRIASSLEDRGDLEGAQAALQKALDYVPNDRDALEALLRLARKSQDLPTMIGIQGRLAALSNGAEQVEQYAAIARLWEEQRRDPAVAADAWRKVLELDNRHREANKQLVGLSEAQKDWISFVEYGQRLLPLLEGAERSSLLRKLGIAFGEHLHRPDEAQRLLEKAGSEDQPDLEAIRLLDAHYTQRGEWDRLADVLERLARVSGDTAERSRSVARLAKLKAETLHDREGANGAYLALLELEPNHDEALRYCSDYLYDQRKLEEAVALFRRRESIENDRDLDDFDAQIEAGMFFYRFADALRLMGEKEEAIRRYERALDLNSTHLPTLEAVGPLYMAAAAWPKAEKVYRQLVQLTGGHGNSSELAHIYARLGTVEARLGQLDKARKRFSKALEIHPDDTSVMLGMTEVLYGLADWQNLLTLYNNIIYHTQDLGEVTQAYVEKGVILDG